MNHFRMCNWCNAPETEVIIWNPFSIETHFCLSSHLILRLPFDYKTPFGFLLLSFVQIPWAFCIVFSAVPVISFFIGSCWLFTSFVKDVTNDLHQLNLAGKSKRGRMNVKERFCNLVQVYTNLKELSSNLPSFFSSLQWSNNWFQS